MFAPLLQNLRDRRPLVHAITNYVTANDCANLLLACGASPIMADEPEEAPEITARAAGLVLNLGTLHRTTIPALLACGRTANARGIPVVLDPVGVGASRFRRDTALRLLREVRFTVIRGNLSEMETLARGQSGAPRRGQHRPRHPRQSGRLLRPGAGLCPPHGGRGGHERRRGPGQRRGQSVLHPQRPPHDGAGHRHGLPAVLSCGGLSRRPTPASPWKPPPRRSVPWDCAARSPTPGWARWTAAAASAPTCWTPSAA